jgi:hypothetical protein
MAKFGLFKGASQEPQQVVEGDYMVQKGEYVTVFRNLPGNRIEEVAAFNMEKNFLVKKMD